MGHQWITVETHILRVTSASDTICVICVWHLRPPDAMPNEMSPTVFLYASHDGEIPTSQGSPTLFLDTSEYLKAFPNLLPLLYLIGFLGSYRAISSFFLLWHWKWVFMSYTSLFLFNPALRLPCLHVKHPRVLPLFLVMWFWVSMPWMCPGLSTQHPT